MKCAAEINKIFRYPLTAVILSLAGSVFGQQDPVADTVKLQKPRVVARGHFSGTKATQQILVWQEANPTGGGTLPYAKAYLAIDAVDSNSYTLFQADGGETQYLVDAIQLADLDGDGIQEILSLWWEGASAGAVLRVFHFDRSKKAFVELKSADDLAGIHRYRLLGAAKARRRIAAYSRTDAFKGTTVEYELRDSRIVSVKQAGGDKPVNQSGQKESGIEGQTLIGPVRPHIRIGDTEPNTAPYKAALVILAAGDQRELTRLETGADGRFRVTLPPGQYLLRPLGGQTKMAPRAETQSVTVLAGQFTKVNITFDNGMR